VWNLWTEEPYSETPRYSSAQARPNGEYTLVVNLSALKYEDAGVWTQQSSQEFRSWLERHKNADIAGAEVVVEPDPRFFLPMAPQERIKDLRIDLGKIRAAAAGEIQLPQGPFEMLRRNKGDVPFVFATQTFRLRTGAAVGTGYVSLSIWLGGKPVDEVAIPICVRNSVADLCEHSLPNGQSLRGIDLTREYAAPDVAFHLIDAKSEVVAVFRCDSCDTQGQKYLAWHIPQTSQWVGEQLAGIENKLSQDPDPTTGETRLSVAQEEGAELRELLFPHSYPEAMLARKAIEGLVASSLANGAVPDGRTAKTLFARLVPDKPDLILIPLNLLLVAGPHDKDVFLGSVINVQSALELEDNTRSPNCVSHWQMFVPPADKDVSDPVYSAVVKARAKTEKWIEQVHTTCPECVLDHENQLSQWLRSGQPLERQGIVTLSHHSPHSLYLHDDGVPAPAVGPMAIARDYTTPGLVILAGCGTGQVGASEFVRQFNSAGIHTIIATSTEVDGEAAGEFVADFFDLLSQPEHVNDPAYGVGAARFDAAQKLSETYGPTAQLFIFAGNPATKACSP
jgi:hypothetical protein